MRDTYIYDWEITLLVVFENGNGDGDGMGGRAFLEEERGFLDVARGMRREEDGDGEEDEGMCAVRFERLF